MNEGQRTAFRMGAAAGAREAKKRIPTALQRAESDGYQRGWDAGYKAGLAAGRSEAMLERWTENFAPQFPQRQEWESMGR